MVKSRRGLGHVTYFSNFGTPNISGTAVGRNWKFCREIDARAYQRKSVKNGEKGAWPGLRDLLFKFWDPLISQERLKIETSNVGILNRKIAKMQKRGVARVL